jgi:hypothetical protein
MSTSEGCSPWRTKGCARSTERKCRLPRAARQQLRGRSVPVKASRSRTPCPLSSTIPKGYAACIHACTFALKLAIPKPCTRPHLLLHVGTTRISLKNISVMKPCIQVTTLSLCVQECMHGGDLRRSSQRVPLTFMYTGRRKSR